MEVGQSQIPTEVEAGPEESAECEKQDLGYVLPIIRYPAGIISSVVKSSILRLYTKQREGGQREHQSYYPGGNSKPPGIHREDGLY